MQCVEEENGVKVGECLCYQKTEKISWVDPGMMERIGKRILLASGVGPPAQRRQSGSESRPRRRRPRVSGGTWQDARSAGLRGAQGGTGGGPGALRESLGWD